MSRTKIQELRKRRKDLHEANATLLKTAHDSEAGAMTEEQTKEFDARELEFKTVTETMERLERHEDQKASLLESAGTVADGDKLPAKIEDRQLEKAEAIDVPDATLRFLFGGLEELDARELEAFKPSTRGNKSSLEIFPSKLSALCRAWMKGKGPALSSVVFADADQRAMGAGAANLGEEMVPEGFWPAFTGALKAFGGMRQASNVIQTDTGNPMPFPTYDDTGNTGALLAENAADTEEDVPTGETILGAYKFTSKIVRVSVELEQDSFFAIAPWLGGVLGERIGRSNNFYFTKGTGVSQPTGVETAAPNGSTSALNTAIARDDILAIIHSVDPAYRVGPSVRHMFNDSTLELVKKIVDLDGRPLYNVSARDNAPDTIEGYQFSINQDVDSIGATLIPWFFGDWSKFIIRDALAITLSRLVERYADSHQVGYVSISRSDSNMVDGGGGAIKSMDMPA